MTKSQTRILMIDKAPTMLSLVLWTILLGWVRTPDTLAAAARRRCGTRTARYNQNHKFVVGIRLAVVNTCPWRAYDSVLFVSL